MSLIRTVAVAGCLSLILVAGATADITCTVTDEPNHRISVLIETDVPPLLETEITVEDNATLDLATCLNSNLPADSCTFFAKGFGGPAMVEIMARDSGSDVLQPCGPFDNSDGLPVTLVEYSVE